MAARKHENGNNWDGRKEENKKRGHINNQAVVRCLQTTGAKAAKAAKDEDASSVG